MIGAIRFLFLNDVDVGVDVVVDLNVDAMIVISSASVSEADSFIVCFEVMMT